MLIKNQKLPTWYGVVASYIQREVLTWPNLATLVRAICTAGIFAWAEKHVLVFVFWLALVGALSDVVDGWLAKRFNQSTQFGKRFDQFTDWYFGFALIYAIHSAAGFTWYNVPLAVMIAAYLFVRATFPLVDTSRAAKVKTALQFTGAVFVLGGHAFEIGWWTITGYLLIWASIWLMGKSLWDYKKAQLSGIKLDL